MDSVIIQGQSSEEDSCSAIESLNDDCLINIFNLLPIVDKIRAERVCKRWQAASKDSWSKVKVLSLHPKHLRLIPYFDIKTTEQVAKEILKRCGRYLEKIDSNYNCVEFGCISAVAKYCTNIRSITCNGLTVQQIIDNLFNFLKIFSITFLVTKF